MNINCKGQLLDLSTPKVMGILNLTPDSFYDGGKYSTPKTVLEQTERMLKEGATFIDVGAYSSRPDAQHITEEEELNRIVPIIELLLKEFPEILLSIDTFRSKVAQETVNAGAAIINDISGGSLDEQMFETVAKLQVSYILMHMKGTPQTMKNENSYQHMLQEIIFYFSEKVAQLRELKLNDIIIDPGFGFGKTLKHNYQILAQFNDYAKLGLPLLAGLSRKSMIGNLLNRDTENRLAGSLAGALIAAQNGAHIIRVHDVRETADVLGVYQACKQGVL